MVTLHHPVLSEWCLFNYYSFMRNSALEVILSRRALSYN